ncbi:unnamed protein product [Moneuplotes crassus]|uniref:Uncharacterized protein n=1 Tax=Euplotes crassus TaxID=5936 RepID=A0AAD1Y561_EUPCR|nr:unnamed protein product [Moneuplotes crassus]
MGFWAGSCVQNISIFISNSINEEVSLLFSSSSICINTLFKTSRNQTFISIFTSKSFVLLLCRTSKCSPSRMSLHLQVVWSFAFHFVLYLK